MKRLKKIISVFSGALLFSGFAFAEIDYSGKIGTDIAAAAPWTSNGGKIPIADLYLDGKVEAYNDKCSAVFRGLVKYDFVQVTAKTGELELVSGENGFGGRINEAYFDYDGSWWAVRIGRQLSMWGAADNFIVSNVLCPVDQTNFNSINVTDKMLGIDAVRLSFNSSFFVADLYWIPLFTPDTLPEMNASISKPEISLVNGEYGLRFSTFFSFADFSLYGYYGWEDKPVFTYKNGPSQIQLEGNYERFLMVGFDSSIPAGPVTVRLEGAYYPERCFGTSAEYQIKNQIFQQMNFGTVDFSKIDSYEKHNQLCGLIGLDWISGNWTITAQYFADYIFGDAKNLDRQNFDHKASLSVAYSIPSVGLDFSVAAIVGLTDFDSAVVASVEYGLTDQFKFGLAGYLLNAGPDKDGEYGKLKEFSCLKVSASYSF